MMSPLDTSIQRFSEMPRAARWAFWAGLFIVCFLIWNDRIRPIAAVWDARAEEIRQDLAAVQDSEQLLGDLSRAQREIKVFGPVRPPARSKSGSALADAVTDLLREYRLSNESFTLSPPRPLPRGTLTALATGNDRIEAVAGDFRFESSPADAAAVIARLESHRDIEAVTSVLMRRLERDKVEVQLTIESWVIGRKQ
ncbi:MAG: hypothetical protein JSV91_08305 [Phycisphaerales bacterium]|nr:MAG: hypothetical protein JSV91_08305 [Phycisphaerales bacterium]